MAIHTIAWSISWFVCGGWCHRRHLQSRGKRPSNGHIHFSTSFFYLLHYQKWVFKADLSRPFFWDPLWLPLPAVKKTHFHFHFIVVSYFLRVGLAAHYYSWRFMQHFLGLVGLLIFFIVIFYLPETSHPNKRGVDNIDPSLLPKWRPVFLNPLQPLWLLRSPNLLVIVRNFLFFLAFQSIT